MIEAHIEYSRDFDLQADCELRSPDDIERMAVADGREPDTYCEFAVGETVRRADDENRSRSREIYGDMEVTELSRDDDRAFYELTSSDGDYLELVEVEESDGNWFIASITDEDVGEDH